VRLADAKEATAKVRQAVSTKTEASASNIRSLLRGVGRITLWTVVGLLLVRGVVAEQTTTSPQPAQRPGGADPQSAAFAIRFARTYLANPTPPVLEPFLAEGAQPISGRAPQAEDFDVAQAEVSAVRRLGSGRAVLTVACELRDSRTLYLAVPITRTSAGEVAALSAPSIVAGPGRARTDSSERPQALAGSEAPEIQALVSKFLPEYLSASDSESLSYLLAPNASVQPLGGAVQLDGITAISQVDQGDGAKRTVLASARVSDPISGAIFPVAYRLSVVDRGGRWYVASVEGAAR
jgi:hypothetical protein